LSIICFNHNLCKHSFLASSDQKTSHMQSSILAILSIFLLIFLYFNFVRPWQLHWGATQEEIDRPLQGDDIVPDPSFNATRAVTIHTSAQNIFPWIVQMGMNRAGWYSYDLLDNFGRRSAETILPEYQDPRVGDLIPMSPDGKYGIWVRDFQKDRWMLWWNKNGDTTWIWVIEPESPDRCRLLTRIRTKYRWLSFTAPFNLLIEFCDLPMMRKSMIGIKRRAEALPPSSTT
jgi:hypothetical protein